jgi:hypothetical protein
MALKEYLMIKNLTIIMFLLCFTSLQGQETPDVVESEVGASSSIEQSAPFSIADFFTTAPIIKAGVDGGSRTTVVSDAAQANNAAGDPAIFNIPNFGGANSGDFWTIPWISLGFPGIELIWKTYYEGDTTDYDALPVFANDTEPWNDTIVNSLSMELVLTGLEAKSTLYFDPYGGAVDSAFSENSILLYAGNVKAKFADFAEWDTANGGFLFLNGKFADYVVTDAYFEIDDLFSFMDTRIGGSEEMTYRMESIFAKVDDGEADFDPTFPTFNGGVGSFKVYQQDTSFGFDLEALSTTHVPIYTTYDLGFIEFYKALRIPVDVTDDGGTANIDETDLGYWLAGDATFGGQNNILLGLKMPFEGLGMLDFGWEPGIGQLTENSQDGTFYKDRYYVQGANRIYTDFNFDIMENLDLQLGLDVEMIPFEDQDGYGPESGADAQNAQSVTNALATSTNLGIEAQYDLDLLSGLSNKLGLYLNFVGGRTWENTEGTAGNANFGAYLDANYPTGTHTRLDNLTESNWLNNPTDATASRYGGHPPITVFLSSELGIAENMTTGLINVYQADNQVLDSTDLAGGSGLPPVGYYSTNKIELYFEIVEGFVTIRFDLLYNLYLGIPSASDLGYTDDAVYFNDLPAIVQNPWQFFINYKISF